MVVVLLPALILAAGMAYDGGEVLNAKVQAQNDAAEAARAGAQALSVASRHGPVTVSAASAAAEQYLATTGHTGTVTVAGVNVTVTVPYHQALTILTAFGMTSATGTETATAAATEGITAPGR